LDCIDVIIGHAAIRLTYFQAREVTMRVMPELKAEDSEAENAGSESSHGMKYRRYKPKFVRENLKRKLRGNTISRHLL